jgi:hypothetical protein
MAHKMQEFILWSNCTNRCDFCWQCKIHDTSTILTTEEMIASIFQAYHKIKYEINDGDDILLVGGEILNSYSQATDEAIKMLIDTCVSLVKENKIRYLYINTNLIYENRTNLDYLLKSFNGIEDRLKFTTSYDVYGRFNHSSNKEKSSAFLSWFSNMLYIKNNYPNINIVVNVIITKQLIEKAKTNDWITDWNMFQTNLGIKYINFIPYIPVEDDRSMDVTFKDIVKVLAAEEKRNPGYINFYINDFDNNQDKILYEYHKDKGYVECTAKYSECHHNENFKKVLGNECYICKLKEVFR